MEINLLDLRVTVETNDIIALCVALRKCGPAYSRHFKELVCRYPTTINCNPCPVRQSCVYTQIFGQDLSHDPSARVRYQKPPLPFVISLPAIDQNHHRKMRKHAVCRLVMLGSSVSSGSLLVESFSRMLEEMFGAGHGGEPQLVSVECLDYFQASHSVNSAGSGYLDLSELLVLDGNVIAEQPPVVENQVEITFVTPLMLMDQGKVMRNFDVGRFLRTLLRRVSALLYYYCGIELQQDFKYLSRHISGIELSDSSFHWQENGNGISGICGTGILRGDVHPLSFFLRLGELFHLGKGASYGMGQFFLK